MNTFRGWERVWGPERRYARTCANVELEAFGSGLIVGIQPLRWAISATLQVGDDIRMATLGFGPFHLQAHCTNNSPEAIAARDERSKRSVAKVLAMLEERRKES